MRRPRSLFIVFPPAGAGAAHVGRFVFCLAGRAETAAASPSDLDAGNTALDT